MACDPNAGFTVGPTARTQAFPIVSVTDCTCAVVSFHPTAITFKFPAACADANGTVTMDCGVCGTAALACTNVMDGSFVLVLVFPPSGLLAMAMTTTRLRQPTMFERCLAARRALNIPTSISMKPAAIQPTIRGKRDTGRNGSIGPEGTAHSWSA